MRPQIIKVNVKEQILKGSADLFFHYGIKAITMDDIAKHLGISKRTIYENFPTKDDIVNTLLKDHLEDSKKQCEKRCAESKNAIEEIVSMMQHIREMFSKMNARTLMDLKKFHPKAWVEFEDFKQGFLMKIISNNLKRAWNPEIFSPAHFELKDVQLSILDHFLYGITNIKGHRMVQRYKKTQHLTALV